MSTTKPTTTREHSPRFTGAGTAGLEFLLPYGVTCPPDVEALNAEAVAAHDRYDEAQREFFRVRAEHKRAPALDRAADAAATAAGEPLPTERVTTATAQALTLAERRFDAAKQNYVDAQILLARSISKHHSTWVIESRDAIAVQRRELRDQVDALARGLDALAREQQVLDGLARFPRDGGSLVGVRFGRSSHRDETLAEHRREQARAKVLKSDRTGGTGRTLVTRDPDSLIGALTVLIDGPRRRPGSASTRRG